VTPAQFIDAGRELYGYGWQTKLAADIGMSAKMVNRYAMERSAIPRVVVLAVVALQHTKGVTPFPLSFPLTGAVKKMP